MADSETALSQQRTPRETLPLETMTIPALHITRLPRARRQPHVRRTRDPWLVALIVCACCAAVATAWWAYANHTILLYSDAHSHLLVARRVVDGVEPGLAQLGDVWLPLPHIIMLPFIWSEFLWRTGLAGTLSSMPCYVIASLYVYLTARRLTHSGFASFVGALIFVLNPNILYLQATPLSEPALFATLVAASYYFVAWAQDDRLRDLVLAALATFLATLARYDGWALYLAMLALLIIICRRKRYPMTKTYANLIVYGTLGGIGIVLWLVWNLVIFGSPLAFLSGTYSSQAQTQSFIAGGYATTYHSLWQSARTYAIATAESIGPLVFALGALGVFVFLLGRRFSSDALAACSLLVPFAFYVAAFYLGQDVMFVPHANHPPYIFYNARFGAEMAAPAAIFIATLAEEITWWLPMAQVGLVAAVLAQSVLLSWGGVISLQDGQIGASCYPGHPVAAYLAQHFDGGRVLIDEYHDEIDLSAAGITFSHMLYEGDGTIWTSALHDPATYADWIIAAPNDFVSQHVDMRSPAFEREFTLVAQDSPNGAKLWHRTGLPALPDRSVPRDLLAPYAACNNAKGIPLASGPAVPARAAFEAETKWHTLRGASMHADFASQVMG